MYYLCGLCYFKPLINEYVCKMSISCSDLVSFYECVIMCCHCTGWLNKASVRNAVCDS